ncbi:MAG: heme biosynthesis HemY N-terminal domain-containing protein [Xanthomonadales bacterium]|jgi:HemY protein|nr:heme biosynthesis HemY N-terminal domain-containing protein [Xanthomonadales bacterium]
MKRSVILLSVLGLLLLTAAIAPVFRNDPGLVQIHFLGLTIETSVLVLLGGFLVLWGVVQLLIYLWKLPAETARRVAEKRGLAQLEKGLLALTEGDWKTAEKALGKSAALPGETTARYLAAAQAASGQDDTERREYYLEQAGAGSRRRNFVVELTRARLLMDHGERAEALPLLRDLHARRKHHPQVLTLLARCHRELGQWDELQQLLPKLRKADVMSEDEIADLQIEIARNQLSGAEDATQLELSWKALPKPMKRDARTVEVYAERAGALERADLAESVLRSSLKDQWSPALVLRYGDPGAGDAGQRLKQCEKWLLKHPEDPALHLALGRLCAGQSLWGKARSHLIKSLELEPTAAGYDALGQLLERQGELELAMACFRNALRMTQGRAPEPLPLTPERLSGPVNGGNSSREGADPIP